MINSLRDTDAIDFLTDIERMDIISVLEENKDKAVIGFDKLHKVSKVADILKLPKWLRAWKFIYIAVLKHPSGEVDLLISNSKEELKRGLESNRNALYDISEGGLDKLYLQIDAI